MDKTLETARQDLAALETDAAELGALLEAQTQELNTLRGGKSRDFARVAELEGTRAALASLLGDQQAEVARAHDHISHLEAQQRREDAMLTLEAHCRALAGYKAKTDAALKDLYADVVARLEAISALREDWAGERARAAELAAAALRLSVLEHQNFNSTTEAHTWGALARELTARGAPGEALLLTPYANPYQGDQSPFTLRYTCPFGENVSAVYAAKDGPGKLFDRPVSITLALAVQKAAESRPHEYRGE